MQDRHSMTEFQLQLKGEFSFFLSLQVGSLILLRSKTVLFILNSDFHHIRFLQNHNFVRYQRYTADK